MENNNTAKPFIKVFSFAFVFAVITLALFFNYIEKQIPSRVVAEICGRCFAVFFMAAIVNGFIIRKSPKVWSLMKIGITTFLLSMLLGIIGGLGEQKDAQKQLEKIKQQMKQGVSEVVEKKRQFEPTTKALIKRYLNVKIEQRFHILNTINIYNDIKKHGLQFGMQYFSLIFEEMTTQEQKEFDQIQERAFSSLPKEDQEKCTSLTENIENLNPQQATQIAHYNEKALLGLPQKDLQRYNKIMRAAIIRLLNKTND
ncbi:hypothetical protein [Candidatus Uabimicrobium sp. HlEnr_7]|uniref:hypothetical protein n=1 Tax=Candidatus Uabimicrobium helgolandensis TaxID=3095367 RepID=UPI0035577DBD